jgi:hypothetical protein
MPTRDILLGGGGTTVPGAPTIGTAAVVTPTSASVSFTPPTNTGGAPILYYTATSSPGGITGTGAGSAITVSGLTPLQSYTFTVTATNAIGTSSPSAASNSITMPQSAGQQTFTGSTSWVVPTGVTSISVVCVGGGGSGGVGYTGANSGGGGALAYVNSISTTPGETLTVVVGTGGEGVEGYPEQTGGYPPAKPGNVGTYSALLRGGTTLCRANSGASYSAGGTVGTGTGGSGGAGGTGGSSSSAGGAGGYAGAGGAGRNAGANSNGNAGAGGGGGSGGNGARDYLSGSIYISPSGGAGGGVGIFGQGSNGTAGTYVSTSGGTAGGAGSGGSGKTYGGGSACGPSYNATVPGNYSSGGSQNGGDGVVRIIWSGGSGITRAFPSTNTGNL